ncbi:MAG: ATP-binding protein [bacterium]|nr:ATP-binding protein [bacterium]
MGEHKKRRSVLKSMFFYIFLGITVFTVYLGFSTWKDIKSDRLVNLRYTAEVIKSYYELTFRQWELTLVSVGKRLAEIQGPDQEVDRLTYANEALGLYDELLAFGYADTTGQLLTFTSAAIGDSLPNLSLAESSKRSFKLVSANSGLVIGESYYFPNVNDWILPVRVPILNQQDELIAINTTAIDYSGIHKELESFNIDKNYKIHIINNYFDVSQIYFPLAQDKYDSILQKPADIYREVEILDNSHPDLVSFEGENSFENYSVIGVEGALDNLNHNLIISVSTEVIKGEFIGVFTYILIVYGILMILTYALFKYFSLKEDRYFKEIQDSKQQLEVYNKNLEMTVMARTLELQEKNQELTEGNEELQKALNDLQSAQKQLVQSEKMASLGIMAAGVGHEINNPLNFIHGGIKILSSKFSELEIKDEEETTKLFEVIDEGVERISKIVTSLSHYSRPSKSLEEDCEVCTIIQNCLLILQNKLKNRIELTGNYEDKFPSVRGNEGKLHQLFLNIISNSEQAIEKAGEIDINLKAHKSHLEVIIKDTGSGISEENLSKISDPFFTTKTPGKGTGLGMFIAHSIIEEHQGNLGIESKLGVGTTVSISLPFQLGN